MFHPKKFPAFSLILASVVTLSATAGPIDVAQAQQNVERFRQNLAHTGRHKAASTAAALRHVFTQQTTTGQPAVYVFTTGDCGFVLAAADDAATSILGYSTEAVFDPNDLPEGLRYMLTSYAEEISAMAASAPVPASALADDTTLPYAVQTTAPIAPLLGDIMWDQQRPFNLKCPVTLSNDGPYSATGCMTTALAQIMYFHKHPQRGYGSIERDVKVGIKQEKWIDDIYTHTYNWDALANQRMEFAHYYTESGYLMFDSSDPGVETVSTLMLDLGLTLNTQYGPASGATNVALVPAMLNYFDYDPSSIELLKRSSVSTQEDWNSLLIAELQAGRPVYLEGFDSDSQTGAVGHAFVCDGYDGAGLFHINWGWTGKGNGYFLSTALDPTSKGIGGGESASGFNHKVAMLRGIQPNKGERFRPYLLAYEQTAPRPGTFDKTGIWVANADDDNNVYGAKEFTIGTGDWLGAEFGTGSNMDIRARVGVLVITADGTREIVWHNGGTPIQIFSKGAYYNFHVDIKDAWKHDGTRVYYIYAPCGENETLYVRNKAGKVCSLRFVEKEGELKAVIEYTETDEPIDTANPDAEQKAPVFPLSFNYDINAPRDDRRIGTIGIQVEGEEPQVYNVDGSKMYRNMTETAIFTVPAGATITPLTTMAKGNWMNAYFYIDRDHDGVLSFRASQLSQEGTDLVSYSFWTGDVAQDTNGQNSAGTPISGNGRSTLSMPAFTAPEEPGTYFVRFKIDWNCTDPAGNTTADNNIIRNGGAIVDAVLIVTGEATPEPDVPTQPEAQLASLYVGYGTSALELFPAFSPDVHLYLARTTGSTFSTLPGSCLLPAGTPYTIFGTPASTSATVSEAVTLRPMAGWNRATITCTAADGVTTGTYHIILLGDNSFATADLTQKPLSIADLSLMIRMLQPDYGYREAYPEDTSFGTLVNLQEVNALAGQLLKK